MEILLTALLVRKLAPQSILPMELATAQSIRSSDRKSGRKSVQPMDLVMAAQSVRS